MNKYSVAVAFADQGKPDYSLALANRLVFTMTMIMVNIGIIMIIIM